MTSKHEQYWDAIVGDHWPALGPPLWLELAAAARVGAATLDDDGVARAVKGFETTIRSSAGLQAALADMQARQDMPRTFASALAAAADTFSELADLVRATRSRISDIVDRAIERIEAEDGHENGGPAGQLIATIVASARSDVIDVVAEAARQVNSTGLPGLRMLAGLLGPAVTRAGVPALTLPDIGTRSVPDAGGRTTGPTTRAYRVPDPVDVSTRDIALPDDAVAQEVRPQTTVHPAELDQAAVPDPVSAADASTSSGGMPAGGDSLVAGRAGAAPTGRPSVVPLIDSDPDPSIAAAQPNTIDSEGSSETSSAPTVVGESAMAATPLAPGVAGLAIASAAAADARRPPVADSQRAASQAPSRGALIPSNEPSRPRVPGRSESASSGAVSADPTASAPVTRSSHRSGRYEDLPGRTPAQAAESRAGGGPHGIADADRLGDAVRAAMVSAGSAHIVGDRVDGDLILARTLLAGILDVVPPLADWAVATMRHAAGLTVLVTSNEGAGYLPPGLYLPPEVSRPWGWKLPEEAIWEVLLDPARVLAEFGALREQRSGARLSAIVSSLPIAPGLRREMHDLPLQGQVSAVAGLELGTARSGRVDRLGLTSSSTLTRRIDKVPESAILDRCERMAMAAHAISIAQGVNRAVTLQAPALRDRILRAWRDGARIDEQWWQDLRDVDDLLAATMRAEKLDVSRIPLGELHSNRGRARGELTRVRRMLLERRCDELALGLGRAPTRQGLRDTVYAYAQIVRNQPAARDDAP
ncbi:hypothetical protein ACIBCD_41410 [Nocardia brasiliensis]|uniref:hypothetical protein n=1 Tax=Nocardia brasiliensis TaxID=37326 RepID=UPI003797039F